MVYKGRLCLSEGQSTCKERQKGFRQNKNSLCKSPNFNIIADFYLLDIKQKQWAILMAVFLSLVVYVASV